MVQLRSFLIGMLAVLVALGVAAGVRAIIQPPEARPLGPILLVQSEEPSKPARVELEKYAPDSGTAAEPTPVPEVPVQVPPAPPVDIEEDGDDDRNGDDDDEQDD